jgi:hypothetical protein
MVLFPLMSRQVISPTLIVTHGARGNLLPDMRLVSDLVGVVQAQMTAEVFLLCKSTLFRAILAYVRAFM